LPTAIAAKGKQLVDRIERLGGIEGHRSTSQGWMGQYDIRPGKIQGTRSVA
jgi:hypothetical protein